LLLCDQQHFLLLGPLLLLMMLLNHLSQIGRHRSAQLEMGGRRRGNRRSVELGKINAAEIFYCKSKWGITVKMEKSLD
jgi:hypothetical protein